MKKNVISAFMLLFTVTFINAQSTTNVGVDSGNQGTNNSFFGYQAGQLTTSSNNSFFGAKAGAKNTTGLYNLFIGNSSGFNNISASNNLFIGSFSGYSNVNGNFNLFLGANAGLNNTSASNNLFLGYNSGKENTTGNNNLFIGATSGFKNTLGNFNTFIGKDAGRSNTSASYNMFLGAKTGYSNTTGTLNTFLGYYSGYANTTGINNVYIGALAGQSGIGDRNVFIGSHAGFKNKGEGNVLIGNYAGYNEAGSNKLYIENSNDSTPLIYGDFSTNRIGINTKTFNSNESLAVKGNTFIDGALKSVNGAILGEDVSVSSYPLRLGKNVDGEKKNFLWHISKTGYLEQSVWDFNGKRRQQTWAYPNLTSNSYHDTNGDEFFKVQWSQDGTFLQMGKPNSKLRVGRLSEYLPEKAMVVNGASVIEGDFKANTGIFEAKSLDAAIEADAAGNWQDRNLNSIALSAGRLVGTYDNGFEERLLNFFDFPNSVFFGIEDQNNKGRLRFIADKGKESQFILLDKDQSEYFKVLEFADGAKVMQMGKPNSRLRIGTYGDYLTQHAVVIKGSSMFEGKIITNDIVGIGTSNPDPKFKLSVNGQVRAKEVTVETDWADYVFEKDYNLPTLKEVETHIKEKGHLKNIPSAKEVAEKGIKIGEINAKLLEKIEELTLYTISQEKKIQTQENRLKRLEQLLLDKQNK
ncbi:conserved exported hypothetical protein [Tenacibaculum sp. 190524A02b]|uniref:Uncharacterized protein n=1 Tax=Tenacibaculum vairaonense TaxID=3137860 RepID=A0ABP1F6Q6_9FLAO